MKRFWILVSALGAGLGCAAALGDVLETYEGFAEGSLGTSFSSGGVNYLAVNDVAGKYPDGAPFAAGDLGNQLLIEDATLFYNDFPAYGSPVKSLTFGGAFIPGPNLTIGALSSAQMRLDEPASAASLDIAYYENGPWGGIVYHLDALLGDSVVASDSFVISDLGGRDNPAFRTLSVAAPTFERLHLYATLGANYTSPRGMIDDLSVTAVPEPAAISGFAAAAFAALGRRRAR